jgi:hypothetical protein
LNSAAASGDRGGVRNAQKQEDRPQPEASGGLCMDGRVVGFLSRGLDRRQGFTDLLMSLDAEHSVHMVSR